MKINSDLQKAVGRKYMRLACLYGADRKKGWGLDYSADALIECYLYESFGGNISEKNGFYAGKRSMDITVSDAIAEIREGNFCKAEFLTPLRGWYWKRKLSKVMPSELFAYREAV